MPDITLIPATPRVAQDVFQVVDANRDYIGQWLPWAYSTLTVDDEIQFLRMMTDKEALGSTYMRAIQFNGQIVGSIDLHNVNREHRHAEIGYFLSAAASGKGIMHTALAQMEDLGFDQLGMNKIDILAATDNLPSRHVAERAHYHLDGILREDINVNGILHDAAVYSKLYREWVAARPTDVS
ncbi:GNAT family N-acetyltransferase [Lacticaseibacillus thailandensis]|uniref:N-acetyltransferase domain-containing protein n=1 Tax=Lacticaseibacillus thailandensis DSM 22698 = JCM 13996 TaxID=1423810 RepID=A0A0R2C7A8_9LACO|nr:GNAT family protein [Lacticaseibacillus thailandensis]KRM87109.1 hypothetical protein FD19_GL001261 [Lacticaseibacillus thailandensis DSM 22698 = JCM 13996]